MCVHLKRWPIDVTRRSAARRGCRRNSQNPPLVLVEEVASRQLVVALCDVARSQGVRPGMTLAEARALCPGLAHAPFEPAKYLRGLERFGRWLMRFSPAVAPEPPDGVFLDVTGSERLFGGIDVLARQVAVAIHRMGIAAGVAVAPTPGAAWAVASSDVKLEIGDWRLEIANLQSPISNLQFSIPRSGPERDRLDTIVVPPSRLRPALEPLPTASLRIDPATDETLRHLGIETIGQLLAFPRESLSDRFGPHLLRRLDQALGHCAEVLSPLRHRTPVRARVEFDGAVESLEGVWLTFKKLIEEVLPQLARRGCGARRVEVEFKRACGPPVRKTVLLSRPSRDPVNLFNLLRCAMETVHSDDGFTAVGLSVPVYERVSDEQIFLLEGERHAAATELAHLVERLTVRLGQEAVVRARLAESHLPEKAWKDKDEGGRMKDEKKRKTKKAASPSSFVHPYSPPPRPLHLLPTPAEVRVTAGPSHDGDGVPLALGRGPHLHRIVQAAGPERISPVWWDGHNKTRDYYAVEDDAGRRFWIFRVAQTGKWYLHGEFE
jgi:protein ImuB